MSNMPSYLRESASAARAARVTGPKRVELRRWLVEQMQAGQTDPQDLYEIARNKFELMMSFSSFKNGHFTWATLEVMRTKPRETNGNGKQHTDPEEAPVPRARALTLPREPEQPPEVPIDGEGITIQGARGRFVLRPAGGGLYKIELAILVDRATSLSLTGQAFSLIVPGAQS